jgi:predicted MFS family arabinose efflux permease
MDRRLLVLALGTFAIGTDSFVVAGVLPQISRAFHVSVGAAGQMTMVYALAYALMSPTVATIAAHVERKRLMLSGLGVFVMANLATAASPTFAIALFTRIFAGLGAAMFVPTATGSAATIVAPEKRGMALAVVVAGLTASTALGSPLGTIIGGLGDWRWTMAFVSVLGALAALGIWALLAHIPLPPQVTLARRLAPLADHRVGLTLLTTLLVQSGTFTLYTYYAVAFDRATGGNPVLLGALLVLFGAAGTAMNLAGGRLIDSVGNRKVMVVLLVTLIVDTALAPWSSAHLWSAAIATAIFGAAGWGILVPQQHRLVDLAPTTAPVVLGLNTSSTYLGVSSAAIIGAIGLQVVGRHNLGLISSVLMVAALLASEVTSRTIAAAQARGPRGTATAV